MNRMTKNEELKSIIDGTYTGDQIEGLQIYKNCMKCLTCNQKARSSQVLRKMCTCEPKYYSTTNLQTFKSELPVLKLDHNQKKKFFEVREVKFPCSVKVELDINFTFKQTNTEKIYPAFIRERHWYRIFDMVNHVLKSSFLMKKKIV